MKKLDRFTFSGILKGGVILPLNGQWVRGMMSMYEDCRITVIVERKKSRRSKNQNAYMWGVVYPEISKHTGHTPNELHEIFKSKFLRSKMVWRGADITTLKSSTELSVGEMQEFLMEVIREANELGIVIPEADRDQIETTYA